MSALAKAEPQLIRYEAACRALAEAKAVDEVQEIRNRADAMRIYMRQSKNKAMEIDAAEIRIRAERRLGQLIEEQKRETGLNRGGRPSVETGSDEAPVKTGSVREPVSIPTLADAGIDKKTSSRAQKLAAVPAKEFEAEVEGWRERVQAENARVVTRLEQAGERAAKAAPKPTPDAMATEIEQLRADLEAAHQNAAELADLLEGYSAAEQGEEAAAREIARLKGQLRTVETQRDSSMRTCNELRRTVKSLQRKIEKLEAAA